MFRIAKIVLVGAVMSAVMAVCGVATAQSAPRDPYGEQVAPTFGVQPAGQSVEVAPVVLSAGGTQGGRGPTSPAAGATGGAAGATRSPAAQTLPLTGADMTGLLVLGAALVAVGVALTIAGRRRDRRATT